MLGPAAAAGAPPVGMGAPQVGTAAADGDMKGPLGGLVAENVGHNARQLQVNRHMTAVLAGVLAGICGLENLWGFSVYLLLTLLGPLVFMMETPVPLSSFFIKPSDPFINNFLAGFLTFVLSWTLCYNLVYVF